MNHYYLVFPRKFTEAKAKTLLDRWGAQLDLDSSPTRLEDGDLCIPVTGPVTLLETVSKQEQVKIYDNEARPGLTGMQI